MTYRYTDSIRKQLMAGCLGLLAITCAAAQSPQTDAAAASSKRSSQTVPLVSDTCPTVRGGDRIALDWNPGFDHLGPVAGLRTFTLVVARLTDDGQIGKVRVSLKGGRKGQPVGTPIGNGFYHIEIPVPAAISDGVYKVVDADAFAEVMPQFDNDPHPQMTVSPARERFCFTVLPR